jgi:thiol-disulfide isomerase/thioredoxin
MTRLLYSVLVAVLSLHATIAFALPERLPDRFAFLNLSGIRHGGSNDFADGFTVIQFWASWCVGCGPTMSTIAKWQRGKSNIRYLALSVDDEVRDAKSYFSGKNTSLKPFMKYSYFDETGKFAESLNVPGVPFVLVADGSGKIVWHHYGHFSSRELLKLKKLTHTSKLIGAK